MRNTAVVIATLLSTLGLWALGARPLMAQDFDEYTGLVERANAAHQLLEGAPEHRRAALAETALEADLAVIDWLDVFLSSEAYGELPSDQQALVVRNRYRWEYNASALLIDLDRCEEARDRVRSLLDRPIIDEELRPRLTEAYDDAITCVTRPRYAILRVEATPGDAEVFVDGALEGLAGADIEVSLGDHTLTVRAAGFVAEERPFTASEEGQVIDVGPIRLMPEAAVEADNAPTWYEWTLWSAGAVGVGVGIYYILEAADRQDTVDNPPSGFAVADPDHEQGIIDDLSLIGYLSGGVGLAAIVAGTISYVVRDKSPDDAPPGDAARVGVGPGQVWLSVPF